MNVRWILQTNIFKEKAVNKIIDCFKRFKIPYDLVKIIPFSNELPEGITEYNGPTIAYGTTTLLRNISKSEKYYPGMWFDKDKFKPSVWGKKYGNKWLNKDSKVLKVSEVLDNFESNTPLFIRPNSDWKLFTGDIFQKYEYEKWIKHIEEDNYQNLKLDTEVTISSVKNIIGEWRFVIIDKEVITGSQYRLHHQLNVSGKHTDIPERACDLAYKIAYDNWQISSAYVIDICQTLDGFKIIEVNCFNASGFYECDINKIIYNANLLAEKEWKIKYNE